MVHTITLNGESLEVPEEITITQLLMQKKVKPELVTVEKNGTILSKEDYDKLTVANGDTVEFLYYMGGGKE